MTEWILCVIKSYQTLFVGLLGFSGVIITMLTNATIQRNQVKRTLLHEANSLRTALGSELKANVSSYELRISQFNEPSDYNDALIPNNPMNSIYKEMLGKVGLLNDTEVEKIINAYALISELPYRTRILVGTDNIVGFNDESLRVKSDKVETVAKMHIKLLPVIIEAVTEIERQRKNA